MNRGYSKLEMREMPVFVQSVMQARKENEEGEQENQDPNQS
jgi:hypothetical protein